MTFSVSGLLCQLLLGLIGIFLCSTELSCLGAQTPDLAQKTTDQLVSLLESSQGEARTPLQLALLKRLDAPIEVRDRACDDLISRYEDQGSPTILGAAYAGKGKVLGDRLDFSAAVRTLEIAEQYGRQCEKEDPTIFFKARCNRVAFMSAQGERNESVKLLQEALEYAKPYGDRLDVPFAYAMLGRLAEASGAIDKAFEYLQQAFESAVRADKVDMAAQAGISILEIAFSEQKFKLAREWLERIEPWVTRSRDPRVKFALALRREDLVRAEGDPERAAAGIQRLIDAAADGGDEQSLGLMYISLAASHFAASHYEAAMQAADAAAVRLKPVFRSWALSQLTRAESLFALKRNEDALTLCNELLDDERLVAVHRISLLELKSQILAALERHIESLQTLQLCRQEEAKRDNVRAHEVAQFIVAAYDGRQREAELKAARASQETAESQSKLAQEIALRERTSAANDRFIKNAAITVSLVALALGLLLIRVQTNRMAAMVIAQREREMNEDLQRRLERQAAELKDETATRQQLELAVERKFRDEALGKLTGGVAHDFNNLLTVILHSTDLLRMQNPQLPAESSQLLDAINEAADSGSSIVSQLMAYTRQQPLEPKPVAIHDWLANVRTMFKQTIGKPIEYQERDLSQGAVICIDTAQLTTAIINLLANARDAIRPDSGTVELAIGCLRLDEHRDQAWRQLPAGDYAQFQVSDTGRGMSNQELQHACEPFFTTKNPGAGTGLGLSTVLGFVKQSGGELKLVSQAGGGTTVTFLIPLTGERVLDADPSAGTPRAECGRLLLVEDQDAVRMVLAAGLRALGYEVTLASRAEEAIAIINQVGAPQVLLSDVRMPGAMSGVQLRRWVLDRFPHVHVVLMSGYRELDAESQSDDSIVFLQKPVKLQELHRALALEPQSEV